MTNAEHLASFVVGLRFSDLPVEVVEKAKEIAVNTWGVQLACSTLSWSKGAYRFGRSLGGPPESTVVNYGLRTSAANAAFINGAFGYGFEMDDNHQATALKGGCVVVPTALATGECRLSSGREMITAIVAGYEVMVRVGLAAYKGLNKGLHHPLGSCGAVGAAATAGKLLGLDQKTMVDALNNAVSDTVGSLYSESATTHRGQLKRAFGGIANFAGIRAVALAEEGLAGPPNLFEAGSGISRAYDLDDQELSLLTDGLGSQWEILEAHYKVYAQDGFLQPVSQALGTIREQHDFRVEQIEEVRVGLCRFAVDQIVGPVREPVDLTDAQYSAHFSTALYLVKGGAGFHEYTVESLEDPEVLALSKRVVLEVDEEVEREFQRTHPRGARVVVRLKSGEQHSHYVADLRMLSSADIDQKFRSLANVVLDSETAERLLERARGLDDIRVVTDLSALLVNRQANP